MEFIIEETGKSKIINCDSEIFDIFINEGNIDDNDYQYDADEDVYICSYEVYYEFNNFMQNYDYILN